MRRAVHCLLAVLALAACSASWASNRTAGAAGAGTAGTAGVGAARCGPAGGRTLAADAGARVYSLQGSVYGCANRSSRLYRLGGAGNCISARHVGPVIVAGTFAAYGLTSCGVDLGTTQVIVRRLSDGRQLVDDGANSLPLGPESYQSVGSLVVRADGDVAWIAVGSSIVTHRRVIEVHEQDRTGDHLLDTGAGVRPGSLRLRGDKLTWRHGHALRSATLR
jgi:hypothetical protein